MTAFLDFSININKTSIFQQTFNISTHSTFNNLSTFQHFNIFQHFLNKTFNSTNRSNTSLPAKLTHSTPLLLLLYSYIILLLYHIKKNWRYYYDIIRQFFTVNYCTMLKSYQHACTKKQNLSTSLDFTPFRWYNNRGFKNTHLSNHSNFSVVGKWIKNMFQTKEAETIPRI